MVAVPVTFDDNGTIHKTKFYDGALLSSLQNGVCAPNLDWVFVGIQQYYINIIVK